MLNWRIPGHEEKNSPLNPKLSPILCPNGSIWQICILIWRKQRKAKLMSQSKWNWNAWKWKWYAHDMRICILFKNVAGYEVIWRVSEESWNISTRSSHEVHFDGCSWQMCAAANVQLCWLVAHCKWYNLGCLDGGLHTPLQIWYNPTVAEQYKGSGTVSVFSSSRFPSILFLQLMAIIIIFSLFILLTFNFHVVSVSYIVTFKKCPSDDKRVLLIALVKG